MIILCFMLITSINLPLSSFFLKCFPLTIFSLHLISILFSRITSFHSHFSLHPTHPSLGRICYWRILLLQFTLSFSLSFFFSLSSLNMFSSFFHFLLHFFSLFFSRRGRDNVVGFDSFQELQVTTITTPSEWTFTSRERKRRSTKVNASKGGVDEKRKDLMSSLYFSPLKGGLKSIC